MHSNILGIQWLQISSLDFILPILRDRETFPNESTFRASLGLRMGQSMFISEGELWKEKHKILQPLMNQKMMEHSTNIVHQKTSQLMDAIKLDLNEGNGVVEIVSLLKRYTLDVIGAMAFGVDFASLTPNQRKVSKNLFS